MEDELVRGYQTLASDGVAKFDVHMKTGQGNQKFIILPDGSQVIDVPYLGKILLID